MSTLKADTVTAATTNGNLAISNQGTGGIAIDGIPHRNLIINGEMMIAARGASFTGLGGVGIYTLDQWRWNAAGAGEVTVTQDTDAPTPAEAGTDFKFSLKIDVTTADASLAATDQYAVHQKIEAFNTAHLGFGAANAATMTLSFWVKSPKTGAHSVAFNNSAFDKTYLGSYTVDSADTWEKKTIKFVGDTGGTWIGATNGMGLSVMWTLAQGSNFDGTAGSWASGNLRGVNGGPNCMDNTANNFYLTGVQLEVGATATDFEHRDIASELARCQRYFYRQSGSTHLATGVLVSTTNAYGHMEFPVTMRATPTNAYAVDLADFQIQSPGVAAAPTVMAISYTSKNSVGLSWTKASGGTAGYACSMLGVDGTNSTFDFIAEL